MHKGIFCVTGASRGIGQALAKRADANGHQVYGCSRNPQQCTAGYPYAMARVDVAEACEVQPWLASIPVMGANDKVVVNHGILGPRKKLRDVTPSEFEEVMRVNANGVFNVLQAILHSDHKPGVIAIMSSSVGRTGRAGWGPYSASKFVVESLVQTLSEELPATDCVVFAFNPGGTATAMRAQAFPGEDPETLPTASQVASVLYELAEKAEIGLHGQSIDCRALIDV